MFELRDYQKRAIEEVTARIQEGHRRIVVNIAMGGSWAMSR
ncbi:MAG: DEAD/DEAH box helicase family protein [Methylococcaceae bacterium]